MLAHFWLTSGALSFLKDDRNGAVESFAAASRLRPDLWIQPYGTRLRRIYDSAAVGVTGVGELSVEPDPGRRRHTLVDGARVELPATVDAGLHLFQLTDGDVARFHELVLVPEDGAVAVSWTPPEAMDTPVAMASTDRAQPPVFLYGAIGAGALSGVAAGAALLQNGAMKRADTVDAVDAAYRRQVGFAVGSYTLLGAAATGLTLHVVL